MSEENNSLNLIIRYFLTYTHLLIIKIRVCIPYIAYLYYVMLHISSEAFRYREAQKHIPANNHVNIASELLIK